MKKIIVFAAMAVLLISPSWSQQKVSAQQLARLFQQIDSGKITGVEIERLLEGQQPVPAKKQAPAPPEAGPSVLWGILGQVITSQGDTATMIKISVRELGFTTGRLTDDVRKAAIGKKVMVMGKEYTLAECPAETARLLCEQPITQRSNGDWLVPFCAPSPNRTFLYAKQSRFSGKWKVRSIIKGEGQYPSDVWYPWNDFVFRLK